MDNTTLTIIGLLIAGTGVAHQVLSHRRQRLENERKEQLDKLRQEHLRQEKERAEELARQKKMEDEQRRQQPSFRVHTIEVLVAGRAGVGKTQLIWTLQGKTEMPQPTIDATKESFVRSSVINSTNYVFLYQVPDIGGDDQFMHILNQELVTRRPEALVFMVDHAEGTSTAFNPKRAEEHMRALYSIMPVLSNPRSSRCRLILFLINKMDIWGQSCTPDQMRKNYSEHIGRLRGLGFHVIVETVSARNGAYLNVALTQFESALLNG